MNDSNLPLGFRATKKSRDKSACSILTYSSPSPVFTHLCLLALQPHTYRSRDTHRSGNGWCSSLAVRTELASLGGIARKKKTSILRRPSQPAQQYVVPLRYVRLASAFCAALFERTKACVGTSLPTEYWSLGYPLRGSCLGRLQRFFNFRLPQGRSAGEERWAGQQQTKKYILQTSPRTAG